MYFFYFFNLSLKIRIAYRHGWQNLVHAITEVKAKQALELWWIMWPRTCLTLNWNLCSSMLKTNGSVLTLKSYCAFVAFSNWCLKYKHTSDIVLWVVQFIYDEWNCHVTLELYSILQFYFYIYDKGGATKQKF